MVVIDSTQTNERVGAWIDDDDDDDDDVLKLHFCPHSDSHTSEPGQARPGQRQ